VEDRGLELPQETPGKAVGGRKGAAKCAAEGAVSGPVDADLAEVIAAWSALPEPARLAVLGIVRSAG